MKSLLVTILLMVIGTLYAPAQLLWKISGRGIEKPSYILGTHHAVPFTYCDSIPGLMEAFEEVDYVIGEFDMIKMGEMTPVQMQNMQKRMMMPADTTLLSLFNVEEKELLDAYLKETVGAELQMFSAMKPMTIMVTVQNRILMDIIPDIASMTGIDKYMQTLAVSKGKSVGGLETMEYQMSLLYGSSLEEQADALLEMAQNSNSKELLIELTAAYKSQNLDILWNVFKEQMTRYEYDALVSVRNRNWEKQIVELVPAQSSLFVVGSGHLPGEKGMITLLKQAGYNVEPIQK
ncbi:MAG: TraB/GumN family protein [Bacteroidales bacterium]|nr:TraB/GumN family protein [Bacteroidales bacterium]